MNTDQTTASANAGRDAHIAVLIGQYPHISSAEIDEIKHWWKREASALDIAMMSGRPEIAPGYALFRQEQIDPLPGPIRTLWVIAAVVLATALLAYLML